MPRDGRLATALLATMSRSGEGLVMPAHPEGCCDRCEETRKAGFTCGVCGFEGEPRVIFCRCPEDAAQYVVMWTALRDRVAAGEVVEYDGTEFGRGKGVYTVKKAQALLDAALLRARPEFRCSGECAHGLSECPVCAAIKTEEHDASDVVQHLGGIIRDVRALLTQEGIL